MQKRLIILSKIFRKVEMYALTIVLGGMVFLSALQIFLRTFFKAISWFDTILNYTVLWTAVLAAAIVTYEDNHIKIDIIGKFVKDRLKHVIYTFTSSFAGLVSFTFSLIFLVYIITIEFFSKTSLVGGAGYGWIFMLILPLSFLFIAIRFMNISYSYYIDLIQKKLMGIIYFSISIVFSLCMLILLYSMFFLEDSWLFLLIPHSLILPLLSIFIFMLILSLVGLVESIRWVKNRNSYYLAITMSLFYALFMIATIFKIVNINVAMRVSGQMLAISEKGLNMCYLIPLRLFFLAHYGMTFPIANYLQALYPRAEDDDAAKEAE
jgi:TRAP-type C4-dicarboxylate transport system permease small subunit